MLRHEVGATSQVAKKNGSKAMILLKNTLSRFYTEKSIKTQFIFFYFPIIGSAFLALAGVGFFKLAMSFNNEG